MTIMRLISDYFSYVPTIPGPPHSPGNNSYQVKQITDNSSSPFNHILCQIFMLIYLQAGSPHHMAPHQNSFVSKVGSDFEFYISISRLIPRTVRHFKGREDSNIRLLWTFFMMKLDFQRISKSYCMRGDDLFIKTQTGIIQTKTHIVPILSSLSTKRKKKFLIFVISRLLWSILSRWRKDTKSFPD